MFTKLSRLISIFLITALLINLCPRQFASAVDAQNLTLTTSDAAVAPEQTEPPSIVSEDISKRGEYHKEFILSNGLRMATVYAEPVHYEEGSQWLEIDNTLKASGNVYTNTAGKWSVAFPRQLTEDSAVTITKDGYCLRFYMAGALQQDQAAVQRSALSPVGGEAVTVQAFQNSVAQLRPIASTEHPDDSEFPQVNSDKLRSRLEYSQIDSKTDIVYDLNSNQVKESIVIDSYDPNLRGYRYTLNVGSMTPVLTDSGEILLYGTGMDEIIMTMPAPFLVDDLGEYCYDVQVSLTGSGSTYTLTYLLPQSWLSDTQRQWPVILDPVVNADISQSNIKDVTVYEKNPPEGHLSGILEVGYHIGKVEDVNDDHGVMRTYLKYQDLPSLSAADVVVNARLALYKPYNSSTCTPVEVHQVLEVWDSTTTNWSNKPDFSTEIEEFDIVEDSSWYYWNITDLVREWYEGENNGLMLKTPDWVENKSIGESWKQFLSSDYGTDGRPVLSIVFRNNNGLESYWDYTASSAGRAGTGYINNYTGNLVWTHSDIGFGGNRMPVSINRIYNANDIDNNDFGMGYGWRTNYHQTLAEYTEENAQEKYYVWEDADGTAHYFHENEDGVYEDEDGLEMTLTLASGTLPDRITDKDENTLSFDTQGRLFKLENNQKTKSTITIDFISDTSRRISKITDGAGRTYNFSYDNNFLNTISYNGHGETAINTVSFTYQNSCPITVTYPDSKFSQYTYDSNHLLTTAQDIDGYKLTYAYTTQTVGKPNRIASVTETSNDKTGGTLSIEYAHNQTTFTDNLGNVQIMQFNNWGNTLCIQDSEGRAQFADYASDDESDGQKGNQLQLASKLQNTVGNMLSNSSFESSSLWTAVNSSTRSITTAESYLGNQSIQVTKASADSDGGIVSGPYTAEPGVTYTFSAYVKTGASGNAYLALGTDHYVISETIGENQDWTRLQVTFAHEGVSNMNLYAKVLTSGTGTVYADCVQLEKAVTASRYNIIENGDFRNGSNNWTKSANCDTNEITATYSDTAAPQLNKTAFQFVGEPQKALNISQQISISGASGDTFVLAGWAKGNAVPFTDDNRTFAIQGTFTYTDGSTDNAKFTYSFNPDTDAWQYTSGAMVAKQAYNSIKIELLYDYNANTVLFDGIQLYKEEYGNSYTYDDEGNVTSVKDLQGTITEYEYADNNTDLLKVIQNNKAKVTYEYDDYHNVIKATTLEGCVYTFTYDDYGNNTSVSIKSSDPNNTGIITCQAEYTADGNRLVSTTDAMGNTTQYSYNADTNVLEWVQYPCDTEATRTNYTYDEMYRIAEASLNNNQNKEFTAAYTYENDLLMSIQTASTTYNFTYGDFALRSSIKVGDTTLANYSYESGTNRLSTLDYGNGDQLQYTYDQQGRVTKQTYEDDSYVTYEYDNSGALAKVYDSQSGMTSTYYYDFTDRLMKYAEKSGSNTHSVSYGYDSINNLTGLVETINGVKHTTSYTYDDDNRITSVENGQSKETYAYDSFGRTTSQTTTDNGQSVTAQAFIYKNNSDGAPTNIVSRMVLTGNGFNAAYTYTYDANGNITSISDGLNSVSYVYDSSNQLCRENNEEAGITTFWDYDDAGNITKRRVYAYSIDSVGIPLEEVNYVYNDSQWGDLLKAYNGKPIARDEIGNPTNDFTWRYTWQHGRELASMSRVGQSETWQFTYNADGLRTQKTNGTLTYQYTYLGDQLSQMTADGHTLYFTYDTNGSPISLTYDGTRYYYITNLQGDIIAILDSSGNPVTQYTYDAWGNPLTITGSLADTVGYYNPLRYRAYVYDSETELYYLQSRYYNPEIGRFINADGFASTGQGVLGNNAYTYCNNNPVIMVDECGNCPHNGRFYTNGPFKGQFEYSPDCFDCAMHGEFWVHDIYGNLYDLSQNDAHEFSQMAICTDGGTDSHNSSSHQNKTAYSIKNEYMEPTKIRYVVAPVGYNKVKNGDLALVIDCETGNSLFAIVGDRGPKGKHNEVSLCVAWDLGYDWADGSRGPEGDFQILYFPGTHQKWDSVYELEDYLN